MVGFNLKHRARNHSSIHHNSVHTVSKLYASASLTWADDCSRFGRRYSNVFLTNLLNRAFFTSPQSAERGNAVDHISIALTPSVARPASNYTRADSTQSGDRSLAYAAQKAMVFAEPEEPQ